MINHIHIDITVADQQYQNNLHNYHLVKNMNSSLRKIVVAAIDDQWLKGAKYLVMGYTNKTFVELFYWLYISYGHIKPVDLMNKQDTMQALYHVEDPIEIIFD